MTDWVEHVLTTDMTAEMFEMGATMRHRGSGRPDMAAIEHRIAEGHPQRMSDHAGLDLLDRRRHRTDVVGG